VLQDLDHAIQILDGAMNMGNLIKNFNLAYPWIINGFGEYTVGIDQVSI
jgi:hypothetical protein